MVQINDNNKHSYYKPIIYLRSRNFSSRPGRCETEEGRKVGLGNDGMRVCGRKRADLISRH